MNKLTVKLLRVRRERLFYKLFFSFIIFLVIPIFLLSTFTYFGVINYAKDKISSANMVKLQLVQNDIETVYSDAKNVALALINDKRIDNAYFINDRNASANYDNTSKALEVISLFNEYKGVRNYIQSIYIYNQNEQSIICEQGVYKMQDFYDTKWIDEYKNDNKNNVILTSRRKPVNPGLLEDKTKAISVPKGLPEVITFVFPLKYSRIKGAIAINIKYDMLFKFLKAPEYSKEEFYVLNKEGNTIYTSASTGRGLDTSVFAREVLGSNMNKGSCTLPDKYKDYIVMFSKSQLCDMAIVDIMYVDLLFNRIEYFRTVVIVLSGLIIIIGLALSYLLSSKIYSPVGKVLEELKSHILFDPKFGKNELSIISDTVNELLKKEKESDRIIDLNRKKLLESQVIGMVMGKSGDDMVDSDFLYDCCTCLVISIDKYELFTGSFTFEEQCQNKLRVLEVCDQAVNTYAKGLGAVMELDEIVMLVSIKKEAIGDFYNIVKTICDKILVDISKMNNLSISIGVGSMNNDRKNIRSSYIKAKSALKYRLIFGHACVVNYDDISHRNDIYAYPLEKESYIINCLKSDSYMEIEEIIHEIIKDLSKLKYEGVSYESVFQTVMQLVSRIIEYLVSNNMNTNDISVDSCNIYLELMKLETLDDVREWLLSFFGKIVEYQKEYAQNIENKRYISKVIAIIQENYTWSDLNIEWIGEQLNISYSHLRRIFKNAIGINFIDYLNKARIDYARELLLNTDLTIKEIALKSGYNNDQCFTRFLKDTKV